jgi:hypothetical protein
MRLPESEHVAGGWRIRAIAPDFRVEDVWALPVYGSAADFGSFLELMTTFDPTVTDSLPARALWVTRDRLGSWLDLGRISEPPSGGAGAGVTLTDRLPDDLRGSAADVEFRRLPFEPLYRTDDEFAAELSNKTVHGVLHLAWVEQDDGRYGGQMAVYVKPRGLFGRGYMALIKPFRLWVVYPALMRQLERAWARRAIR